MDKASGKIELSKRYIKKLNFGHTLQSHDVVVLCRNNGIRTPSVTTANIMDLIYYAPLLWSGTGKILYGQILKKELAQ